MKKINILFATLFVLLFVSASGQNTSKFYLTGYNGSGACDGTLKYSLCGVSSATFQLLPSNGYTSISGGYENMCYGSYTLTVTTPSISVYYYAILNYTSNGVNTVGMYSPPNTSTLTAFAKNVSNTGVFPTCNGSFTLNVAGGVPPYNVVWYNSSSSAINTSTGSATTYTIGQLCSGNYSFDIADNNPMLCSGDWVYKPTIVHIPCYISDLSCSISVSPASSSSNCDGSANLISTSPTYSITSFIGATSSTNQTTLANQCYGNVTATIHDVTGAITQCTNTISFSTNINDVNKVNSLSIFPNPTNSVINISDIQNQSNNSTIEMTSNEFEKIELLSFTGQVLLSETVNAKTHQLQLQNLAEGIYFVKVSYGNGMSMTKKVVKQ